MRENAQFFATSEAVLAAADRTLLQQKRFARLNIFENV